MTSESAVESSRGCSAANGSPIPASSYPRLREHHGRVGQKTPRAKGWEEGHEVLSYGHRTESADKVAYAMPAQPQAITPN